MSTRLRIATRKSMLAMWQANHVRDLLKSRHPGLEVELVPIVTRGDQIIDRPLAAIGGKGLFLKELEQALLRGDADLAVHSMKDVPALEVEGLRIEVVLDRANPCDALLSRRGEQLADLPPGSKVGTSSLRRQCQLLRARPDLTVHDLRGNVDTRLAKLAAGEYNAIILARAGLDRLGFDEKVTQNLEAPDWLPASTQGIIGIQSRSDDEATRELIEPLNHSPTMLRASAERRVAASLEASCQLPVAVFAEPGDPMKLHALVGMPDGTTVVRAFAQGSADDPEELGDQVAGELLSLGAGEIISALG